MPALVQSLVLFKRHLKACPVHKSKVPKKARRFWMGCPEEIACPIWIYGRTPKGDIVPRQSTGFADIRQAEAMRDSLIRETKAETFHGLPVSECIEKYLALRKQDLDARTLGQHRLALERLSQYLTKRGTLYIQQMTVDQLESFKTEGLPADMRSTSRANMDAKIRCFLRMAFRREWIKQEMVHRVTAVRAVYEQKEPYTDDEVKTILDHALLLNGGTHGYAAHPATFRLLLEVMLNTGMRVGDAVRFDPSQLAKGESMWVYTFQPQKKKRTDKPKVLEAYLSDDLKSRIEQCDWLSPKGPFWCGSGDDPRPVAQAVYERMQNLGTRAGIADCRPHRLRDTFAVRRLLGGMQLEDVSRLLGHSSVKVTETYYAKWISSRKRRLERLLSESLVNA